MREIQELIAACELNDLPHRTLTEKGGDRFLTRTLVVSSPAGIEVWFEGPNEA